MADITLAHLTKVYDNGHKAVASIDLAIKDREFMVLVGPSGCGKTTTLRMIAGLETVTSGEIRLGGQLVNDMAPKNRDLAMVFQNYALYPHMTVFDNMGYGLLLRGVPRATVREKVTATARMLGLESELTKRPKQLSGGQRQRVALGRAIVRQPKAFLFDEPLSNLDAKLRSDMRYELKTLQQRLATTMVYVTHDQIEAMTLGDRITVMHQGRIQQVGPPTEIYRHPCNRFVAAFMGTPAMNFLPGRVARDGSSETFQLGDGGPAVALNMGHRERLVPSSDMVVLGIRPECLVLSGSPGPGTPGGASLVAANGGTTVPMTVTLTEAMGDHQVVYLKCPGVEAILTMTCATNCIFTRGAAIAIVVDTREAHVFGGPGEDAVNLTLPETAPTAERIAT